MIFNLIAWACLAHLVVDLIVTIDTEDVLPNKPFKCDMCVGFWVSVIPMVIYNGWIGFCYAAVIGVLTDLIYRLKNRI